MRTVGQSKSSRFLFQTIDPVQSNITITAEVVEVSTGTVVDFDVLSEIGNTGKYYVDFNFPTVGNFIVNFNSPSIIDSESEHVEVIASTEDTVELIKSVVSTLGNIEITIDNIDTCVEFLKKISTNRVLIDESVNELIIFEDDNTTPLLRFPLKDINGNPTSTSIFETLKGIL